MPAAVANAPKKAASKSKNAYRRAQKKAKKETIVADSATEAGASKPDANDVPKSPPAAHPTGLLSFDDLLDGFDTDDPAYELFKEVLDKFHLPAEEDAVKEVDTTNDFYEEDGIQDEEEEQKTIAKLSKKARRALNTPSIADLKAMVAKPELVEWTDTTSSDPMLLIEIKGTKNVIPVPIHWSNKREYLSSKRGVEKPPFVLPKFIQETGVSEMRDAFLEQQAEMSLKQKQRERVQGKVGKLDLDYTKLWDAFFRRQTKPEMTRYGEVYYEGKEYETNLKHLRPGNLSDELMDALGMNPGGPPPWLINQQRCGLPPSYPNLKIPGVNAPPPPGQSWGFLPGQYGKPPTHDDGTPLFGGDFHGFSELQQQKLQIHPGEPVERGTWGELRANGESEDEEEEDDDEEEADEEEEGEGLQIEADPSGTRTAITAAPEDMGGIESIGGEFTLRKQRKGTMTEEPHGPPRSAYQVLPEKNVASTGFYGSERTYDLDAARRDPYGQDNRRKRKADVEVSVDVDALGDNGSLSKDALRKQYDAQKKAEIQGAWESIDQDDLSEMIMEQSRKRHKKEEEKRSRR